MKKIAFSILAIIVIACSTEEVKPKKIESVFGDGSYWIFKEGKSLNTDVNSTVKCIFPLYLDGCVCTHINTTDILLDQKFSIEFIDYKRARIVRSCTSTIEIVEEFVDYEVINDILKIGKYEYEMFIANGELMLRDSTFEKLYIKKN